MSTLKVGAIRGVSASSDAITVANDGTCTANVTNNLSHRNIMINGDMQVAQRGVTFNSASNSQVTIDRFRFEQGGTSVTDVINVTQKSNAARDIGFEYSLKAEVATVDSSLAADHFTQFKYQIETQDIVKQASYGLSTAKKLTLSFYVKSSVTGTFPIAFNDGSGSRSNPHIYTINSADTWERKTITINGDTGGNWQSQANNAAGFGIRWGLAVGSGFFGTADGNWSADSSYANLYASYSNSLINTQGATWELTGVQLELGSTATDYEHKSFMEELQRCQRYYCQTYNYGTYPGANAGGVGVVRNMAYGSSAYAGCGNFSFPVKMRTTPTCSLFSRDGTAGKINADGTLGNGSVGNVGAYCCNPARSNDNSGVGNQVSMSCHVTADAEI